MPRVEEAERRGKRERKMFESGQVEWCAGLICRTLGSQRGLSVRVGFCWKRQLAVGHLRGEGSTEARCPLGSSKRLLRGVAQLGKAATCTVLSGFFKSWVIPYKERSKSRSHSGFLSRRRETQVMEGRGSSCRLGPKVKKKSEAGGR